MKRLIKIFWYWYVLIFLTIVVAFLPLATSIILVVYVSPWTAFSLMLSVPFAICYFWWLFAIDTEEDWLHRYLYKIFDNLSDD